MMFFFLSYIIFSVDRLRTPCEVLLGVSNDLFVLSRAAFLAFLIFFVKNGWVLQ